MAIRNIKAFALGSALALCGIVTTADFAEARHWSGKQGRHYGWHSGWHKDWHSHRRVARTYRPRYYGMGAPASVGYGMAPASYGYSSPANGGYSTPGYYGYGAGACGGGLFGGSGLLGLGTGIL